MNFKVAIILYPGAFVLFLLFKILQKDVEFNDFMEGQYREYSFVVGIVIFILFLFFTLRKI